MVQTSKIIVKKGSPAGGAFSQYSHRLVYILQHHQKSNDYSLKSVQDKNHFLRYQRLRHRLLKFIGRGYPERLFFSAASNKCDLVEHPLFQHTQKSLLKIPNDETVFDYYSQYADYRELRFDILNSYIAHYFFPSVAVQKAAVKIREKYSIDVKDTYVLHYRRFDQNKNFTENKGIETTPPSIDEFIEKFHRIYHKGKIIVLLTIDTEMQNRFREAFPQTINITEGYVPVHSHKNQSVQGKFNRIYSLFFNSQELECLFAQVYLLSQSHTIFTTSGNLGQWLVLYRGHNNNVYQYLNHDRFWSSDYFPAHTQGQRGNWF